MERRENGGIAAQLSTRLCAAVISQADEFRGMSRDNSKHRAVFRQRGPDPSPESEENADASRGGIGSSCLPGTRSIAVRIAADRPMACQRPSTAEARRAVSISKVRYRCNTSAIGRFGHHRDRSQCETLRLTATGGWRLYRAAPESPVLSPAKTTGVLLDGEQTDRFVKTSPPRRDNFGPARGSADIANCHQRFVHHIVCL